MSEVVLVPEYFYDGSWRRARVEGDTVLGYRKFSGAYVRYSNFVGNGVGVRAISGSVEVSGYRGYGNTSGIYVNGGTLKIVGNEIRAGW